MGADYKGLEARVVALLSGDDFLIAGLTGGLDIHTAVSEGTYGKETWERLDKTFRKQKREATKNVVYGTIYGVSAETAYQKSRADFPDLTLGDIQRMQVVIRKFMPGVFKWHNDLVAQVIKTRQIRSFLMGRLRAFPLGNADFNELVNWGVQAGAADIADTGMDKVQTRFESEGLDGEDIGLILQVHDFLGAEVPEAKGELAKQILIEEMTQTHTLNGKTMLFDVDAKIGHSWAEI